MRGEGPENGPPQSVFKTVVAQWHIDGSTRSAWEAYRLQVCKVDRTAMPFLGFGRDPERWHQRNARKNRGLAGSAPGRMEGGPFRQRRWSEPMLNDGPGDSPSDDDDDDRRRDDSDTDSDNHNNSRRQQLAMTAALLLLANKPKYVNASSPLGSPDHGQTYNIASQVRTTQHVPRADTPTRTSTISSGSGDNDEHSLYNGRVTRPRRALSAPLQGVLAIRSDEDTPTKKSPAEELVQNPVRSNSAKASSEYSSDTEPFPAYVDPMQHASQELSPPRSEMPASSSSAKQSGGQNLIPDRLPDGFACSSGTAPAPRGRRAATRFRAPVNSPSSQSPFSRHSPAAYQGNKSLTRADTDRTIPSTTTYSSTQATESLSRQTAADGAASPSGQNVSPWVQHLNSEGNAASPSPEESVRRTRRPLWARILRKLFPRGRGVGGGARPGGIKRLWQRVRPRRRGGKSPSPPPPPPARKKEPRGYATRETDAS